MRPVVRPAGEADLPLLRLLFSLACDTDVPFKELDADDFARFFLADTDGVSKTLLVLEQNDSLIGFASGCAPLPAGEKGYISFVYVLPRLRRHGLGRMLVDALEADLRAKFPSITKIEIAFHNPMQFAWWIPGTDHAADHPCAPGLDVSGSAFLFFKRVGYRCYADMNSYYRPLAGYRHPDDIASRIERLRENHIEVTFYDRSRHVGLDDLFTNIRNEGWRRAIMANDALGDAAKPLLVAVADGRLVCGYTGPLSVDPSGRGCFHGIGVHTDYRQHGAGKVLFSSLCMSLHQMGASFMSLYTGEDNPARNIYEAVGFKIVRSWSAMRKSF